MAGSGLSWRRWNAALHRDLGYLVVGLTMVYAISGIAMNHVADWNPNYRRVEQVIEIGPVDRTLSEDRLASEAIERLKLKGAVRNTFQPSEDTLEIYAESGKYSVDLPSGKVLREANVPRPVLMAMNRLHLNAPKKTWTWIADAYAVSLIVLALTGLFILKGPKGITGRGAWLTAAGCALPAAYWIWWAYIR